MQKANEKEEVIEAEYGVMELFGIGMGLVVLGIGLSYGLNVMGDVRDDMTANTAEYNATVEAMTAVAKIPNKLGLIVTVIIASVIIGILVSYLWVRFK